MSLMKQEIVEVCRVCESMDHLLDISTEDFCHLSDKLKKVCDFEDKYSYLLKYICQSCSDRLLNAFDFKTQCEETYKTLICQMEMNFFNDPLDAKPLIKTCERPTSGDNLDDIDGVAMEEEKKYSELYEVSEVLGSNTVENSDTSVKKEFDVVDAVKVVVQESVKESQLPPLDVQVVPKKKRGRKPLPPSTYTCVLCDKTFKTRKIIQEHMKFVHTAPSLSCRFCDKKYTRKTSLDLHEQVHFDTERIPCNICGKTLKTLPSLKSHMRLHEEKRAPKILPFLCDFCGHRSATITYHREHLLIHSDTRQYKCDLCDKSFSQKQGLYFHKKTHSDDKPYQCELCPKAFRNVSHLKLHINVHTGARNFPCQVCEKAFRTNRMLKLHMRIHTGDTPHQCPLCLKKLQQKRTLRKHMLICSADPKNKDRPKKPRKPYKQRARKESTKQKAKRKATSPHNHQPKDKPSKVDL